MSAEEADESAPDEVRRRLVPADFHALESAAALDEQDGTPLSFLGRGPRVSAGHQGDWLILLREGGRYFSSLPGSPPGERWLAIPVSELRRDQLLTGHVPLAEAIGFAEWRPYRLVGSDPFRPETTERLRVRAIPHPYYPTGLFALNGTKIEGLTPSSRDPPTKLRLHLVAGKAERRPPSLSEVGTVQRALERFIETTQPFLRPGRFVTLDSDLLGDEAGFVRHQLGGVDWPRLGLAGAKVGTLTVDLDMGTYARGADPSVRRALPELSPISADTASPLFAAASREPGGRTAISLLAVGAALESFGLSVLVAWCDERGPEHIMISPLTAREGAKDLSRRAHEAFASGEARAPVVRVRLAAAEAERLGIEVDPRAGGFEQLLAELKPQLSATPDGQFDLWLRADQVERVIRYFQSYGQGGAQTRLKPIYEQLRHLGPSLGLLR